MTTICTIPKFDFKTPASVRGALTTLDKEKSNAKVLAGGTDLILQMKQRTVCPSVVVDVKRIPELNKLTWNGKNGLRIGAAVTLNSLIAYKRLWDNFNVLAQACSVIGSVQIKNRATIAGNICNAAPSADSAPSLLCLGAKVVLTSSNNSRTVPVEGFFVGPGKTIIANGELLTAIEIPNPPTPSAGYYLRHTTREEMDIAVAGVASFLVLSQNGTVKEARISLGAVAPTPRRARGAEALITGQLLTKDIITQVAEKAAEETSPISDLRGSADYRCELIRVLTRRTLYKCCEELGITI